MKSVVTEGSKRVIEFARKNHNLSRLLYISSGAVYGNRHDGLISEDMSCEPGNVYGSVKLRAEQYCALGNIPYCIARCFAFVGGYLPLDEHFAIGNFIRDCLENRDIIIKGDGTPTRTYLYSGDLSTWLWTILFNGIEGRIYNVGSDYEVSISQLAELVRNISGSTNDIQILSPPSGKPIHRYGPNISRARQELQLDVETSLEEAIRLTLKQHKSF
jgi:dTDP-glucose 4,6-dehydratase